MAERAWEKRPFATLDALHDAMTSVVAAAPLDEQLALLRAHPDLGAIRSGPDVAMRRDGEQAGAGLDALTRDELERLRAVELRRIARSSGSRSCTP